MWRTGAGKWQASWRGSATSGAPTRTARFKASPLTNAPGNEEAAKKQAEAALFSGDDMLAAGETVANIESTAAAAAASAMGTPVIDVHGVTRGCTKGTGGHWAFDENHNMLRDDVTGGWTFSSSEAAQHRAKMNGRADWVPLGCTKEVNASNTGQMILEGALALSTKAFTTVGGAAMTLPTMKNRSGATVNASYDASYDSGTREVVANQICADGGEIIGVSQFSSNPDGGKSAISAAMTQWKADYRRKAGASPSSADIAQAQRFFEEQWRRRWMDDVTAAKGNVGL